MSKLTVWWLRLGIRIERIKPGHPAQNGRHERLHLTLKKEATKPAARNFLQQQARFDQFLDCYIHERPVVLNRVARNLIESVRGQHPEYVFVYRGKPVETTNNNAWQKARERAQLPQVRVHDLKHTFGRRLRAAGV